MSTNLKWRIGLICVMGLSVIGFGKRLFAEEVPFDAPAEPPPRPNIIFVLADDLGFETVGSYGAVEYENANHRVFGPAKTPNIDALAAQGLRFTHAFCEPVCSPSRSEFLTGKYNFHTGFVDIQGRNGAPENLDYKANPTLAESLKAAGYVTAITGKWHLGKWPLTREVQQTTQGIPATPLVDTTFPHVTACGFDRQFVFSGSRLENYGPPEPEEYVPARFHTWALRFLESRKGKPEPFFLYYASPIPHVPLRPTPLNPTETQDGNINFPPAVSYLDQQVGDLERELKELGMADNTILVFSGDNGTCNITTKMKDGSEVVGGKGTMKDTGAWVPLVVYWPAKIKVARTWDGLVQFPDLMPTFLDLAGAKAPAGIDGISFAPQLLGKAATTLRQWVHVCYRTAVDETVTTQYFVRDSKWKLNYKGDLFDITASPLIERLVPPADDTAESKAARERLAELLRQLHPDAQQPVVKKAAPAAALD